jgi:TolB-like protein/Tfp pilus assembly protein PilF
LSDRSASYGGLLTQKPTRAQIEITDEIIPKARGFDKRLIWVPLALAVFAVSAVFGYRYLTQTRQIESIAVMPFVNESGNADVEYLSDGMTDTLIKSLSQLPNLAVKSRSTVFYYKGKETSPKKLGEELNVQAVLLGRVAQHGDDLKLELELVNTNTQNVIWTEEYDRKQSDLVSLQSEIARDVSSKLTPKLSGADIAKVEKNSTANPEAYQLYLKGKFYWNKRTGESLKQAVEFFNQAIEKDPNYALAYGGLAETYVLFSSYDVAAAGDSMPSAKAAAVRAISIDDSLAEAHTALGFYLDHYEWDRTGAEREFRRAIELNPNYSTAHHWYSANLSNVRRFDESIAELKRAEQLDPLSGIIGTNLGDNLVYAHKFDEAIAQYKRVLNLNPDFGVAHQGLGLAYGLKGMYPEAITETKLAIESRGGVSAKGYLGLWLAKSGKRNDAANVLKDVQDAAAAGTYVQAYTFALIYLGLGDKEQALNYLEKHMASHAETASAYASNPELDDLRSEPRFKAMLTRMNLPE